VVGEKQQITTGLAINDQGTVVGSSGSYELTSAFVWTQSHGIRSLALARASPLGSMTLARSLEATGLSIMPLCGPRLNACKI